MEWIKATGRRKASIARVFLAYGTGKVTVNNKDYKEYFPVPHIQQKVVDPLTSLEVAEKYDIKVNVKGGGIKGQAEAIRMAIARALVIENEENRPLLKPNGYLTRDSRVVERKKPGLRKARKRAQFSKR